MKNAAFAVLALALTSSFAYAHPQEGRGCHAHYADKEQILRNPMANIHCSRM